MLSGLYPFEFLSEANILDLHDKIVKGTFSMPIEANDIIQDLLQGILNVDLTQRFTIQKIQNHPWIKTSFEYAAPPKIATYNVQTPTAADMPEFIPCQTTMLPFLEHMYKEELEAELLELGTICSESLGEDSTHRKTKLMGWIKK
jgi:serine/threonine protein kinase